MRSTQQIQALYADERNEQQIALGKRNQRSQLSVIVVKVAIYVFIFGVIYLSLSDKLESINSQIDQLNKKNQHLLAEVKEAIALKQKVKTLQKNLQELEYKNKIAEEDLERLHNSILDIHMNQLVKDGGNIFVLKKYAERFQFDVEKKKYNGRRFKEHFQIYEKENKQITKIITDEAYFFSESPLSKNGISYIEIQIGMTKNCKILIGVIPQMKRSEKCVYCDSKQIAYFYGENGKIYSGEFLGIMNNSKQSLFERLKMGDKVSMFINYNEGIISWYVNNKYAGKQVLNSEMKTADLYPFVQLTDFAETVRIIE